jgi:hypothetical protein
MKYQFCFLAELNLSINNHSVHGSVGGQCRLYPQLKSFGAKTPLVHNEQQNQAQTPAARNRLHQNSEPKLVRVFEHFTARSNQRTHLNNCPEHVQFPDQSSHSKTRFRNRHQSGLSQAPVQIVVNEEKVNSICWASDTLGQEKLWSS